MSLQYIAFIVLNGDKSDTSSVGNVPDALVDLIKQGRYNSVSIEFLPRVQFQGNSFTNVLRAVALLGAELPAVKGLKELSANLMSEFAFEFEDADPAETLEKELEMPNEANFTQEQVDALIETAVSKAVDDAKASFSEKVEAQEAEIAGLKEDNAKLAEGKAAIEASMKEYVSASEQKATEALIDKAIDDGKILPAEKDKYMALAQVDQTVKFGEDETSVRSLLESILDGAAPKLDLSENMAGGEAKKDVEGGAMEIIHDRTMKAIEASEGKLDYATAYNQVLNADPELKAQYANLED